MKTFTLPVIMTQEDVDSGLINDCVNCPFALAIHRALAPFFKIRLVGMYSTDAIFYVGDFHMWKEHTFQMRNWIRTFDYSTDKERESIKPFPPFNLTFNLHQIPLDYHKHFSL